MKNQLLYSTLTIINLIQTLHYDSDLFGILTIVCFIAMIISYLKD